jgi:RimJ/RimL family protein N-acetyltransferase
LTTPPLLETPRLRLGAWTREDREAFAVMNADRCVMRFMGEGGRPLDRAESDALLDRIEIHWAEHGFGLWAVRAGEGGALLGFCGLAIPSFLPAVLPAVEVGWRLRRDAWGRGYATEAALAAVAWGFAEIGLDRVIAIVDPRNAASLRVCEKLSMKRGHDRLHPRTGARLTVMERAAGQS